MYSPLKLSIKYLLHNLKASNGKGHGVHSPFVYDFIIRVLNGNGHHEQIALIEKQRNDLLKNESVITVEDYGVKGDKNKIQKRKIKDIAATSLQNKKFAQLLHRTVNYFKAKNIIELGTSFGISTSYMALAGPSVITIEGSAEIAKVANNVFENAGVKNVELITGTFEEKLPEVINNTNKVSLAYIDGNHRKEATINYFNLLKEKCDANSVIIFDDIHWSKGMEEAWEHIKNDKLVTLSIDLFKIGIVFFRHEFKTKQHFKIRY